MLKNFVKYLLKKIQQKNLIFCGIHCMERCTRFKKSQIANKSKARFKHANLKSGSVIVNYLNPIYIFLENYIKKKLSLWV